MKYKNIKTILFDYDGTLVDTESICNKLYPSAFKKFGFKITRKQALLLRSAGYPLKEQLLKKWYGTKMTPELETKVFTYFFQIFDKYISQHPIQLKPGVIDLFKFLKSKHIKIVIVSSSYWQRVVNQTKKLGIYKYLSCIYSTQIVKLGKPKPDVYLYTFKQLKLNPKNTIAVEDSPNGIMSACDAGCITIMVPDLTQPDNKLKKKYNFTIVKTLNDVKKLLDC